MAFNVGGILTRNIGKINSIALDVLLEPCGGPWGPVGISLLLLEALAVSFELTDIHNEIPKTKVNIILLHICIP